MYVLIGIGILFAIYSLIQKIKRSSSRKFIVSVDKPLLFIGVIAFGLFASTIFSRSLFYGYDTLRMQQLLYVVLSVFLISGAYNLLNMVLWKGMLFSSKIKFLKKIQSLFNYCIYNQNKIVSGMLLFLMLPEFIYATGIIDPFFSGQYSIIFNSPKHSKSMDQSGFEYTFDQDAMAIGWYKNNSYINEQILSDDYGNDKITSLTNQKSTLYQDSIMHSDEEIVLKRYIFFTVVNEYYNSLFTYYNQETKISSIKHILYQKNKIFENGAVLYK
jgi:hypothetical protein